MTDKLLILAAGASTRMKHSVNKAIGLSDSEKSQANTRSKGLISLDSDGRPLLDYLLYHAYLAGYRTIYIITGKENELFKKFYGQKDSNNIFKNLTINFAVQFIPKGREKPFGTADALYQALEQYPELKKSSFSVCNSDNLYSVKALKILTKSTEAPHAILSYDRKALDYPEARIARFAIIQLDKNQRLINIIEKPSVEEIDKFLDSSGKSRVSMNIFKFDGSLFYKYVKNCPIHPERNEKEIPTALMNMIKEHPGMVIGIPISEHVPDLTSKSDILALKAYVKNIDLQAW